MLTMTTFVPCSICHSLDLTHMYCSSSQAWGKNVWSVCDLTRWRTCTAARSVLGLYGTRGLWTNTNRTADKMTCLDKVRMRMRMLGLKGARTGWPTPLIHILWTLTHSVDVFGSSPGILATAAVNYCLSRLRNSQLIAIEYRNRGDGSPCRSLCLLVSHRRGADHASQIQLPLWLMSVLKWNPVRRISSFYPLRLVTQSSEIVSSDLSQSVKRRPY